MLCTRVVVYSGVKVADLRLKLATVQSRNIVLSNREIRLLRYTASCTA